MVDEEQWLLRHIPTDILDDNVEEKKDIYERKNYLTDDSDSDLDVFVEPSKSQVPPKFTKE